MNEIADNDKYQEQTRTPDGRVVVRLRDEGDLKRVDDLVKASGFKLTPVDWGSAKK